MQYYKKVRYTIGVRAEKFFGRWMISVDSRVQIARLIADWGEVLAHSGSSRSKIIFPKVLTQSVKYPITNFTQSKYVLIYI